MAYSETVVRDVAAPESVNVAVVHPCLASLTMGAWGCLPLLSVCSACGLLLVAIADTGARSDAPWAQSLFWLAMVVLFAPIALRLLSPGASRQERIALVVILALAIYLVKLVRDPLQFTYFDEFISWRNANDVLLGQHLFSPNPIGRIYPYYPGLASVTVALAEVGGLPIFNAGILIICVARLVLMLALYLFYEQIGGSARLAGIATLLYACNPHFLYFTQQYAYESLALPLAVLVLYMTARWERAAGGERWGVAIALTILVLAVVASHHMTSYVLTAFLILWTIASLYRPGKLRVLSGPGPVAAGLVTAIVVWLGVVAYPTIGYLQPVLAGAVDGALNVFTHRSGARQMFHATGGPTTPAALVALGYASVALILVALPVGLLVLRRQRPHGAALALTLASLAYPASLALRLSATGVETSDRSFEIVFLAVAFVLATGVVGARRFQPMIGTRLVGLGSWATILFTGGIVVSVAPYSVQPGPYLIGADLRSIEPEGLSAAAWARDNLPGGNYILTDRTNRQMWGSYGRQNPQVGFAGGANISRVFFAPQFGPIEQQIVHYDAVRFIVVDRRLRRPSKIRGSITGDGGRSSSRHGMNLARDAKPGVL